MKHLTMKKCLLALVALFTCGFASAEATQPESIPFDLTEQGGWTATGEKFIWETDIDFTTQYIEAVLDLSTCTGTSEGILSIGENIDIWGEKSESSGNVIHLYFTAYNSYVRTYAFNGRSRTIDSGFTFDDSQKAVIKVTKEGWYINDVLQGDATTIANILGLTHISVGSQEGSNRSHATYYSIKLVNYEGETPKVEPETIQIPLDDPYTPSTEHNSQFIGETEIDWNTQSLSITIESPSKEVATNEALISIGEDIASKTGKEAGNIHFGVVPFFRSVAANYYNNTNEETYVATGSASFGTVTTITFELSKANGLTYTAGTLTGKALSAEVLAPLFNTTTIQVGSILSTELSYGVCTSTVNSITLNTVETPKEEVAMPESIPFDLTEQGGWTASGEKFAWETDIDWQKQSLEMVLDFTNCTIETSNVISVGGSDISKWSPDEGQLIHFFHYPAADELQCSVIGSPTYRNNQSGVTGKNTILISKEGVFLNGTLWEGETKNGYGSFTKADSTTIANILQLNHIIVGSQQGNNRSDATYLSIKLIDNGIEEPKEVYPDTIQIPLTETYTPSADHNNKYIGTTAIDFETQTLKVALDFTNCEGDNYSYESAISIGDAISSLTGNEGGNIHLGYSPGSNNLTAQYFNNSSEEMIAFGGAYTYNSKKVVLELSKAAGLTATVGSADPETLFEAETLATLLAQKNIEVGSILTDELHWSAATVSVDSILVEDIPEQGVAKPESIPFDLTEEGGWPANGDTFAWDSDIDWDKQALEIVLNLSSCTSTANQTIVTIDGLEDEISEWFSSAEAGHIHFYYTKSSNKMEVNYLVAGNSNIYRNGNTTLFSNTEDNTILVSKDGVKVNGTLWEGQAEQSSYTEFNAEVIAPLTNLTHIWVGSQEGNARSWATYKSIKIIDYTPVTTGISDIETEQSENADQYNLAGQRVGKDYKGIVIMNGKKLVRK